MQQLRTSVLIMAAMLLSTANGFAQVARPAVSSGLVGAANSATLGGSDASGVNSKLGFAFGGFVRRQLTDTWAFQGELQYSMKGTKWDEDGGTVTFKINYLELPLLFRVSGGRTGSAHPFAEFGPALSVRTGCSLTGVHGSTSMTIGCAKSLGLKSFDAGLTVGAGYEFAVGTRGLLAGVRYNYGLMDITDSGSLKNRTLQFVVGMRF